MSNSLESSASQVCVALLTLVQSPQTETEGRTLKAMLEDVTGVFSVELLGEGARVRFDGDMVTEPKLEDAVRRSGLQPADFRRESCVSPDPQARERSKPGRNLQPVAHQRISSGKRSADCK